MKPHCSADLVGCCCCAAICWLHMTLVGQLPVLSFHNSVNVCCSLTSCATSNYY
ncbi:hypothetical protein BKA67DRAFT_580154 [Truncatella angustata]|uniref:Uncharacterized protein n=1 Tax=Truncatella angustata TaxID=152316 RepID=A0A9P8U9T4_9PEZI|nr:uncharacterized protein BKA67DRAFT_580154 [Truncatella angustata]KAH6646654.1 hypothetical protein BKA67DRAFT_580154 [Truncatella angustata]